MSKQNKVNKTNYVQAGRLTPDDMARERKRSASATGGSSRQGARSEAKPLRGKATERIKGKSGEPGASRPRSAPEE